VNGADEQDWTRRHLALMRTQPGHWCQVPGCTGSQPLMEVKTRAEVEADQWPGQTIDMPSSGR